jgi:hypothetical protein
MDSLPSKSHPSIFFLHGFIIVVQKSPFHPWTMDDVHHMVDSVKPRCSVRLYGGATGSKAMHTIYTGLIHKVCLHDDCKYRMHLANTSSVKYCNKKQCQFYQCKLQSHQSENSNHFSEAHVLANGPYTHT